MRGLLALGALAVSSALAGPSPGPNSCAGHCGYWAKNCWCNDKCETKGNCCADYAKVCPVSENSLRLQKLENAPKARCLDGSPAGVYLRTPAAGSQPKRDGGSVQWLIFFEGGGWCYDQSCQASTAATVANCKERAGTDLGSSANWPSTRSFGGSLSAVASDNPVFHAWNVAYVPYCDGTSFTGNATVSGLHFKGKAILDAVMDHLMTAHDLASAHKVVVSGGSAGASAALYHVDRIAAKLALPPGMVVAMPDAGFFLDLPDRTGVSCWPNQMKSVWKLANAYAGLHEGCLAAFPPQKAWKCLIPQYWAERIRSPVFLIQSLYDSSELWYTLRLNCCPAGCGASYPVCNGTQLQLFERLRAQHIAAWAPLVNKTGNGVWSPACIAHTMTSYKWTDATWAVPQSSGDTMSAAVQKWLLRGGGGHVNHDGGLSEPRNGPDWHEDLVAWPNNRPCSGADALLTPPVGPHRRSNGP